MEIIIWATIIGGTAFMIWYGFNLLVRRPGVGAGEDGAGPAASCHLCRRTFPVSRMVSRDKIAGFINYFCGDCIEGLYNEYVAKFRDGAVATERDLGGRISRN
jgi:hypothetical protein